jgi:hypothetical protein
VPTTQDVLRLSLGRLADVPEEWGPYLPSGWLHTEDEVPRAAVVE